MALSSILRDGGGLLTLSDGASAPGRLVELGSTLMAGRNYPYCPVRERDLLPGEFWSIPLSDGRFGCGVVMELDRLGRNVRVFHGVLLDWVGGVVPTAKDVLGTSDVLSSSTCGVLAITVGGGRIEGRVEVEDLPFVLPEVLRSTPDGLAVYRGSERVRRASVEDRETLERHGADSIGSFISRAETQLVTTDRLIVLCRPHPEVVNKGNLRLLLEPFGEIDVIVRSVRSVGGEKVYLAVNPPRRQFIGEGWYEGPAREYLDQGYVPVVFDFVPGSGFARRVVSAVLGEWSGFVDAGDGLVVPAVEFMERHPTDETWFFV